MTQKIYKCRLCGQLIKDNTGGSYVSPRGEDFSVCRSCREEAQPLLQEKNGV